MIKGNMFDVFDIYFSDGQKISMVAKDVDSACALAQYSHPQKQIVEAQEITCYDYDN
jgi:hypothetical protein